MEKPIFFGIAVYQEPYCGDSIREPAQGSSIEEVEEKLEKWIQENISWNEEKKNFETIVWRLNVDGSISWSTDL